MAHPVSDEFNDRLGRWTGRAPWDSTIFTEVDGPADETFLNEQEHVDVRSFRTVTQLIPVPQYPDLDTVVQDPFLDAVFQTDLEVKPGDVFSENWTSAGMGINEIVTGAWELTETYLAGDRVEYKGKYYVATAGSQGEAPDGATAPWDEFFFVGKIAAYGGWHGLQVTTDGTALDCDIESFIDEKLDISDMTDLQFLLPDFFPADAATSSVTLHSGSLLEPIPATVAWTGYTGTTDVTIPLADFVSADTTGYFDLTQICGITIHMEDDAPPAADQTITVMAVRAIQADYADAAIDMDTRWGLAGPTPTLDGTLYGGTRAKAFEFVRGDGTPNDPYPADVACTIYFYGGGETSPPDAEDPDLNTLAIILRETKDSGAQDGSAIFAYLRWNDAELSFEAVRRDMNAGVEGAGAAIHSEVINLVGLDAGTAHAWTVKLVGKTLDSKVDAVSWNREVTSNVWTMASVSSDDLTYRNGRVGFMADLLNRDAYVDALVQAPVGYAILRTRIYETRDPVDGARLQAIYSPDADLFQELTGADAFVDQTKTVSGKGGVRTRLGVQTNLFIVDDWFETYLEAAIWIPANVTRANQPVISLDTGSAELPLLMPALQPSQWNRLRFELRRFKDLVTGVPYSFNFSPGTNPDTPLGYFWVDAVKIGRRKVAWSVRAAQDAQFRRFYGLVNNPRGAVHFNPDERGRHLQLQAEALTFDAWVSEFTLFPHYAELGLPLYDQGFEKRV
jgi:hypothetical protein